MRTIFVFWLFGVSVAFLVCAEVYAYLPLFPGLDIWNNAGIGDDRLVFKRDEAAACRYCFLWDYFFNVGGFYFFCSLNLWFSAQLGRIFSSHMASDMELQSLIIPETGEYPRKRNEQKNRFAARFFG
jgi:hypothetical protein